MVFISLINSNLKALIDDCNYEQVSKHNWSVQDTLTNGKRYRYVSANIKQKTVLLHRFLMNPKKGYVVDHVNHDCLDNRKENLRCCSRSQNLWNAGIRRHNKSGFKGVYFAAPRTPNSLPKYRSVIYVNKKKISLGSFLTAEEASEAYVEAGKKYHGEFFKAA
jgi:hypothetical protein